MSDLSDFDSGDLSVTLDDFTSETATSVTRLGNTLSNKNMAATVSVLYAGEDGEQTYRDYLNSLESGRDIINGEGPIKLLKDREYGLAQQSLMNVLANPAYSDEEKLNVSKNFNTILDQLTDPPRLVSSAVLDAPLIKETKETEFVRVNTAGIISGVNDYRKGVQELVNAEAAKSDINMLESVGKFAELVLPFMAGGQAAVISRELSTATGDKDLASFSKSVLLMGEAKEAIRDALRKVPVEQRLEAVKAVIDIVSTHSGLAISESNEFAKMSFLNDVLETGGTYSSWDSVVDSAFSLLDATILGGVVARAANLPAKVSSALTARAARNAVRSDVKPASVSQVLKDANPDNARGAHEMAAGDASGEAAEAMYGTNRVEAIANDLLPEMKNAEGQVAAKVGSIDKQFVDTITPDQAIMDFVENGDGAIYYFKAEKANMRSEAVTDMRNAIGMDSRNEMFQVTDLPDGVQIRGVYGMRDTGYADPQQALELAKYTFREKGITDKNLVLLKRTEEGYVEVPKTTKEGGDYLVGVDYRYKFNPVDNDSYVPTDVKKSIFGIPLDVDRLDAFSTGASGTLQRTILDPHSMLNPVLTKGANVAVDKTFGLEKLLADQGREFSTAFAKMPKDRQAILESFIRKANAEGIAHTYTNLKAVGMTDAEIEVMGKWKETWDTLYWMENRDYGKSLRSQNYHIYEDAANDVRLFARPVSGKNLKGSVKVYDPINNQIITKSEAEVAKIYEDGGTLAKLKRGQVVGEDSAEFIISAQKQGGPYLRAINEGDQILNYRPGYYQVAYKNPKFIVKVTKDRNGNEISRVTVGNAGNTKDANLIASRFKASSSPDEIVDYIIRDDIKSTRFEDAYDIAYSQGRMAQRRRGQRLQDANMTIGSPSDNHILDPVEALTKSIRSTARRVGMRSYLEASKDRFLRQYGHLVQTKDQFNQPVFPTSRLQLGEAGQKYSKEVGDARTTWEYINYLEGGYVNAIEDTYKSLLNGMADVVGQFGAKTNIKAVIKTEEVSRLLAAGRSPDQAAKSLAFKAYLALNPARQLVVQSHQAIRLFAIEPAFMSTRAAPQMAVLFESMRGMKPGELSLKAAGMTAKEAEQMAKDFKNSGLFASVDANNLIRGDLNKLADMTAFEKGIGALNTPVKVAQKYGFDAGEQANIMSAWLAFRNKAVRDGVKLNAEALDEVSAQARNFTFNMNAAGDFPYNQNMFSMVAQFAQVPHKALLNNLSNRIIPPSVRAKTAAFDIVMFGTGTAGIGALISPLLPDEGPVREVVQRGFEDVALNKMISVMIGEDTDIDFSGLAPSDITGLAKLLTEMWTDKSLTGIIASSPSGQLLFGGNPRITNAIKDGARFFSLIDDETDPIKFSTTAESFAKISSGYSNAFKSIYALRYGQKINSFGDVVDPNVNRAEAVAQFFGFGTHKEAADRKISMEAYEKSKAFKDDINEWYKTKMRRLSSEGLTAKEIIAENKILGEAWRVWGDSTQAREIISGLIKKDLKSGDPTLYRSLSKLFGMLPPNEVKQMILNSGLEESKRDALLKQFDFIESYRNED